MDLQPTNIAIFIFSVPGWLQQAAENVNVGGATEPLDDNDDI